METGELLTIALILWLACPLIAIYLSMKKNRDRNFWVFTSFIVPPTLLILLFLPKRKKPPKKLFGEEEKDLDDSFFNEKD